MSTLFILSYHIIYSMSIYRVYSAHIIISYNIQHVTSTPTPFVIMKSYNIQYVYLSCLLPPLILLFPSSIYPSYPVLSRFTRKSYVKNESPRSPPPPQVTRGDLLPTGVAAPATPPGEGLLLCPTHRERR